MARPLIRNHFVSAKITRLSSGADVLGRYVDRLLFITVRRINQAGFGITRTGKLVSKICNRLRFTHVPWPFFAIIPKRASVSPAL